MLLYLCLRFFLRLASVLCSRLRSRWVRGHISLFANIICKLIKRLQLLAYTIYVFSAFYFIYFSVIWLNSVIRSVPSSLAFYWHCSRHSRNCLRNVWRGLVVNFKVRLLSGIYCKVYVPHSNFISAGIFQERFVASHLSRSLDECFKFFVRWKV